MTSMSSMGEMPHAQRSAGARSARGRAPRAAARRRRLAPIAVAAAAGRGRRRLVGMLHLELLGLWLSRCARLRFVLYVMISFACVDEFCGEGRGAVGGRRRVDAGEQVAFAGRDGNLDALLHRSRSASMAPPHSEGSRATRPDAPIGRSRPSAVPDRRVQGPGLDFRDSCALLK